MLRDGWTKKTLTFADRNIEAIFMRTWHGNKTFVPKICYFCITETRWRAEVTSLAYNEIKQ